MVNVTVSRAACRRGCWRPVIFRHLGCVYSSRPQRARDFSPHSSEMEMLRESRARDKVDGVDRNACIVDRNQFFNTQVRRSYIDTIHMEYVGGENTGRSNCQVGRHPFVFRVCPRLVFFVLSPYVRAAGWGNLAMFRWIVRGKLERN